MTSPAAISWPDWIQAGSTVVLVVATFFYVVYTQRLAKGANCPSVLICQTEGDDQTDYPISEAYFGGFCVNLLLKNVGNDIALEIKCDAFILPMEHKDILRSFSPLRTTVFLAPKDKVDVTLEFSTADRAVLYDDTGKIFKSIQEEMSKTDNIVEKMLCSYGKYSGRCPRLLVNIWFRDQVDRWYKTTQSIPLGRQPKNINAIMAITGYSGEEASVRRIRKRKFKREVQEAQRKRKFVPE